MKSKPVVVAKHRLANYAFLLLVPATLPAIVSFILYRDCLSDPYWDVFAVLFATATLVITCLLYRAIANIHNLYIDDEKLIIKSALGYTASTIYLQDITGWGEIQREAKGVMYYILKLFTRNGTYTINAGNYTNYYMIKPRLVKHKPAVENWQAQFVLRENRGVISFLALIVLVCVGVIVSVLFNTGNKLPDALHTVTGTLVSVPEITRGRGSDNFSIIFNLKQYPGFNFEVYNNDAQATDWQALTMYAQKGEPIQLTIPLADYETKLAHLREAGFWEKHISYPIIRVYGCRDSHQVYLQTGAETNPPYLNMQPIVIAFILGLLSIAAIAKILITGFLPGFEVTENSKH